MKVNATARSKKGTSASRRLRRAGRVPAILYGAEQEAVSLEIDHNELFHSLRNDDFHASILDMFLDGKKQQVLLRTVQWHPYKPTVLHADFQRVRATDPITLTVPFHFINGEQSPAVTIHEQIISHVSTELLITCLPADLPTSIEVDLSELDEDGNYYLSDITLPEGVSYAGTDEDPLLVAALTQHAYEEDEDDDEDLDEDELVDEDDEAEDADEEDDSEA